MEEEAMATAALRHKHIRLDQAKLDRVKRILGAKTDTQALERALELVVQEQRINTLMRSVRGKARIRRVFD